jgi:hypothetical protein
VFEKLTLPLRSRAHLRDYGNLLVDTLGMVVARRVEASNVSDRPYGGAAAYRLTIRLPEDTDGDGRCRLREPQAGVRAKRRHGWRLHITKRRQRAFKVVGLTRIVERTFAWLARNRRLKRLAPR